MSVANKKKFSFRLNFSDFSLLYKCNPQKTFSNEKQRLYRRTVETESEVRHRIRQVVPEAGLQVLCNIRAEALPQRAEPEH